MPEIRDRLNCVREDDQGWRRKLRKINTQMGEYERSRRRNPGGNNENILHEILPTYWEVFHTHNAYEKRQGHLPDLNYDIGIFLVGFSSLPIVLSLAEIQPTEKIYFLYSRDTQAKCYEITDRMRAMLEGQTCFDDLINRAENIVLDIQDENSLRCGLKVGEPSDPVETFKWIKEVIDEVIGTVGDKRIALDLTGGKKTMIGGGFTAGSIWTSKWSEAAQEFTDFCDMFYIDSLKYDADRSAPVPGHEFLSRLKNPYDVYNVQSVQQAKKLFEKHNYEAAAELLESVKDTLEVHAIQYSLEEEKNETVNHHRQTNCYYLWDALYYDKAKNGKNRHGNSWKYNEKHVKGAIDVLDILGSVTSRDTLFTGEASIIHYAMDRYQNAIRRKKSGKLDDAIVRFTQVIEMLCIYKIHQIAKGNYLYNEQCNKVSTPPSKWNITPLILFLFGDTCKYDRERDRFYTISDCNQLLNKTDYDCNDVDEIVELIESRNNFVHFSNPMRQSQTEDNAQNLKNLARKFLKNFSCCYCSSNGLSFDELLELHRFRR